jgi:hypothetical protein
MPESTLATNTRTRTRRIGVYAQDLLVLPNSLKLLQVYVGLTLKICQLSVQTFQQD